ncbi:MAG: Formylglycine-generating sulfatase enzyme [Parcubacteria group bacterium ADurb.Bin216]|jgi:prepilin-type N-terminal cleavage/methylation domain-containing protein|nr:MAG: Formylglycine-generating sulfatase enzyme [Parcubacteria group bacterium ADurb.Bin216]
MNEKSFTLIELLVVIAIIGILAGFIIVSMSGASSSANDSRRKADINQLSKAVMIHKTNNPDSLLPIENCTIGGGATPCSASVLSVLGSASILRDPNNTQYYSYSSIDGNHYTVSAELSDENVYTFDSSTGQYTIETLSPIIPIDGVCGISAGVEHSIIPTENLCSAGIASIVSGDGVPYNWICSGIDGGDDASCSATKIGWIDTGLGFYVMKYEAKDVGGIATSATSGTPWVNISQTNAIAECQSLGSGYHLITNAEWTSLARHIAAQPSNWSTGTVGSGVLSRGYSASTTYASDGFQNTVPAPTTGTLNDVYNTGVNTVGSSGIFDLKRIHSLANGKTVWDLAGNVWEWNSDTCTQGSGAGNWYNSTWIEWSDTNLGDYERSTAGPNPLYTSTQNAGRYLGCIANGNALIRGGKWSNGFVSGVFALLLNYSPANFDTNVGFRCAK